MADSRLGDNVESPLVQPVVDSSTTDVDAREKTTTKNSIAPASGLEATESSPKPIENKSPESTASAEKKSEDTVKKEDEGKKSSGNHASSPKDGSQPTEHELENARSGCVSPSKVDRKTTAKKHTFKPVSVTKQFLKETVPATASSSNSLNPTMKQQGTSSSPNLSTVTPRPTTVSKLKLVRSGASLQASKSGGAGVGGSTPGNEPQPVWNKNKPPPPPTQPSQMTDEELTRKFGIHLASRLGPEEESKEAKWADIDDDDDDWVPETLEWDHKMKIPTLAESKAPTSPISPKPESSSILKDTAHPVPASINTPTTGGRTVLKPKSTLVTSKEVAKTPEPVSSAQPTKSPWAKIAAPAVVPIPVQAKAGEARHSESTHRDMPPVRDVSADGYDRSWRDRGGHANRELFNSQTGQMEPAPEHRLRNARLSPMTKPSLLQRPSGAGYPPPEPSPAFQTHRTRPDDFRRRTNSNMSGGSGGFRRPSFSRQSIDEEYGPVSVFDEDMPLPPRPNRGPRGSNSPGFPPQLGHHEPSPRFRPTHLHRDAPPQEPQDSPAALEPLPSHEQPPPAESGPSPAEIIEMQKRVMRESMEKARQRRLEEEARLEAEKRERLAVKLAELERKEKEKKEKEEAAKAAEKAEKERIVAEAKAAEEQRLAEEKEAAEKKKQEDAEKKRKESEAAALAEQPPLNRAEAATHWRRPEQPKFTPPSPPPQQPQPPPVWSSDKVRNAFNEDTRPSTSTSTPLPPSFPRSSQQSFSSDTQVPRPASTPDASFITDSSRPSFLPPSEPSTSPSPHPMTGVPNRPPLSVYPHHGAPLRGAYPQFPDQMHTISPAPIGPGNMAGAYATNVHPAQSPPQWPRLPGNQYGAIGERTNREQPDRGHVTEMNPSYGRGQSNAVSGMPQSYGRGHMYQANQRFVDHFNHVGSPHQFNADNRGGYGGFNVHQASHQQHYRNQQGIPTPSALNGHAPDHHDPFYPGPPRQGRRPSASPNMNNANLYRGPGRRSPFQGPSGHSPNLGNANLYQQYGRGRRSPSFQGGSMSPNLNHAHMYVGNRQGRPHIPVYNHQDMRSPEPANAPSVAPSIPEHPPSAPGHERVSSLQNDLARDRPARISPGDQQNAKMLAESNPAGISAWGNYNALEDDALRAVQASVDGAHELNSAEPSTGPAIKQTIIFRHRQEKQTDAQADAEVAAWAARRGKTPVAIPEHFKPGYTPPTRDGVASSLPPHLKAKMESQQLSHTSSLPSISSPQSPPPPISDDHPVHGDHLPRVHLPGQHDRRTTTGTLMSQCDRISSVQDMLLSVMSQHRSAPVEPPHPTITVTVSLPPSTCDDSSENNDAGKDSTTLSSSMPGAEEFQESLNHQPFGSTPTIRLPVNMEYPELLAPSDSPVAKKPPPRAPKADSIRPFELKYHPPFVVVVSVPGMGDNKKEIPWKPKLTPRGNYNGSGRGGGGWRAAKRSESSGMRSDSPAERPRGRGRRGRGRGSPQIGDGPSKTAITA